MNIENIIKELEQNFPNLEEKIINTKSYISLNHDHLEYKVSNYLSNESFHKVKINECRENLLRILNEKIKKSLYLDYGEAKKLYLKCDRTLNFSMIDLINLEYTKDFTLLKKFKYTVFYNTMRLVSIPIEFQNKTNYQIYPLTNLKFIMYDEINRDISLITSNGIKQKKIKLWDDKSCIFHVYKSNIFCVNYNFFDTVSTFQVYDFNLNLIKQKSLPNGYFYFSNSYIINYSKCEKNEHQIYDHQLESKMVLSEIYRNPLIDVQNDRIMYFDQDFRDLFLKIITLKDKKPIGQIKINASRSYSIQIDEESNIYLRMTDFGTNDSYMFCYDLNASFLFKIFFNNFENFQSIRLIAPNRIAFLANNTNNYAIF